MTNSQFKIRPFIAFLLFALIACIFYLLTYERPVSSSVFTPEQIQWLAKHRMLERCRDLPLEKQVEIARIIQVDLDLAKSIDSLKVEFNKEHPGWVK